MSWTREHQEEKRARLIELNNSVTSNIEAWKSSVQTAMGNIEAGDVTSKKLAVDGSMRQFREFVNYLRTQTDQVTANGTTIDEIARLAAEVAEEKENLRRLKEKYGTRSEQAQSVNPKVTQSPFVNALWLRRNFREDTRVGLIMASIVFGILAFGSMGFLIYSIVTGGIMKPSLYTAQQGGRRRARFAENLERREG